MACKLLDGVESNHVSCRHDFGVNDAWADILRLPFREVDVHGRTADFQTSFVAERNRRNMFACLQIKDGVVERLQVLGLIRFVEDIHETRLDKFYGSSAVVNVGSDEKLQIVGKFRVRRRAVSCADEQIPVAKFLERSDRT